VQIVLKSGSLNLLFLFFEGEDSHGGHGLGSLVELRFKAPPGTTYSTSEVSYTSATTGRGDHKVHKGHVVAMGEKQRKKHVCQPLDHEQPWTKHVSVSYMKRVVTNTNVCFL
jgi:hypothetical protein